MIYAKTLKERKEIGKKILATNDIYIYEKYLFNSEMIKEFYKFNKIIVLCSGGYESTAIAHYLSKISNKNQKLTLLWNNTLLSLELCRKNIQKVKLRYNNYIELLPNLKNKSEKEFLLDLNKQSIEAIKLIKNGKKYSKHLFKCDKELKTKPFNKFLKELKNKDEYLIVSGLASYEGMQRRLRLIELMKLNTYTRFYITRKINHLYPFRDLTTKIDQKIVGRYLELNNYHKIHSGCSVCPIITLFNISDDKKRLEDSNKLFKTNLL